MKGREEGELLTPAEGGEGAKVFQLAMATCCRTPAVNEISVDRATAVSNSTSCPSASDRRRSFDATSCAPTAVGHPTTAVS